MMTVSRFSHTWQFNFASLLLFYLTFSSFVNAQQVCDGSGVCRGETQTPKVIQDLIDWVEAEGGFVHPSLEIRQRKSSFIHSNFTDENNDDDYSQLGLFVKDGVSPISKGTQILYIPRSTVMTSKEIGEYDRHNIRLLAETLTAHLKQQENNGTGPYGPYIHFLEEYVMEKTFVPATWSEMGKFALEYMIEDEGFTSFDEFLYNDERDAGIADNEEWEGTVQTIMTRSRENALAPIYDIIQHSNDKAKINVAVANGQNVSGLAGIHRDGQKILTEEGFGVNALQNLNPGNELLHSFGGRKHEYLHDYGYMDFGLGMNDLLRDYGLVDTYPQRWYFSAHEIDIEIHLLHQENEGDEPNLELRWLLPSRPNDEFLSDYGKILEEYLERRDMLSDAPDVHEIPEYEFYTIWEYIQSYITALDLLIHEGNKDRQGESDYITQEEMSIIDNIDKEYFQTYQCNTLYYLENHDPLDFIQSSYQQVDFYFNNKTMDTCLYLDDVYQQCRSYWPHYHELVVHKPAKYLSEPIRRVLFVGGGDSGVLNEFLKYPSLELIVGLELDQTVTRQSFKHFASRPSFDNPKVEWWYGDASKSLLMLPKQYFGTFDFVVVDLSDTVFSLSVSSELDVIEAISLLLRPGGIFEMNELFLKKVGNVFEYAIHYQFTDVPKICDQAAIFASNDIDFMNTPLTEHILVENATILVEKESLRTKHQFDRVHDFRRNPVPKSKRLCKIAEGVEQEDRPQQQAPGILMIVEAENLTVDLNSPEEIKKVLVGVLQDLDLQVLPDDKPSSSPWFVIGMKEGYLTVRLFPESRYCALDIHLWSAFDKHGIVKEAVVVKGLGGDLLNRSTSSYRIVAGGMFGLPTWKEDAATHGPQISRTCPKYAEPLRDSPSNANKFEEAVEISLDVAQGENLVVAVLCGPEGEACPSVEVAERNEKVKQVITIHACTSENDYASSEDRSSSEDMDSENAVGSCIAKKAYDLLNQALPEDDDKIHVIIYDFNAPEITSEAIDVMYVHEHMNIEKVVMMATTDSRKELWRRRHIATIRQIVRMDPVHRAHIFLNTTKSSLELSLIATGDEFFFDHLAKAVASSQAKTDDVSLEIRNIFGGLWREKKVNWKNDTEFSQVIVDDDYDNSDAKNQWETQVPLANQTVTQFVNCETGSYNVKTFACTLLDVDREDLLGACEESFKLFDSTMQIYDDIGGDGLVCSGTWETGTAIILWDGRYQVDLNLWTLNQLEELDAFKNAVLHGIPTLKQKLRDIQPRGYGRVVNFKFDLKTKSEKKFVNWAGMPIVDVP